MQTKEDVPATFPLTTVLCASLHGIQCLPEALLENLGCRQELEQRASALVNSDLDLSQLRSIYDMEKELCRQEDVYRETFLQLLRHRHVY
jgi:hypothetical protein